MNLLVGDTPPLRIWHGAAATPIGIPLNALSDTTGKPLASTDLTLLTGKLAIMQEGTAPSGTSDAAFVAFTWVTWADDLGEAIEVARILVGSSGDTTWPAASGLMRVWWQLSDGVQTMGGVAPGSIDLY